jgi:TolB-like protein/Tfp pilus assembly protein PilF
MSFFDELKRRNVFKVGIAYVVVAWLLLQVADVILNNNEAPSWVFNTILLVLGIGFPLILLFAWAFELTPEGLKREKEVDRSQSITHVTSRKLDFIIIGVMALALAYFAYDKFVVSAGRDAGPLGSGSISPDSPHSTADLGDEKLNLTPPENTIAVLPFVNMSSDPEQEYFADGISEEILNTLAQVSELKVAGRTSSFAFKGKNDDLLEIGKLLRVNHILEGSVRKSGNRVRITAQLIKVDDGFHMWSETWDRDLTDIFVIQDEISAAILTQLKTQLLGEQPVSVHTDTKAYELYLLAKQRIYERTQASLEMAEKLLTEAIAIDPGYAPAFAQLGIAYILLGEDNYGTLPVAAARDKSKTSLDRALQLAPENAEALGGKGLWVSNFELDREQAIDLLQRAVAINPNLADANTWLATELDSIGELRAGVQLREQIFARDPLHRPTFGNLQQSYMVMGQSEKALEMLDNLQAYLPGDAKLLGDYGEVYLMNGQLAEARKYFNQAYEKEPKDAVNRFWYGLALLASRQYGLMAEIATDRLAPLALSRLGRVEEALILGNKTIGNGQNPDFYIWVLMENGRFAELIRVIESRWPSLDDFSSDWPGRSGYGYNAMGFIAQAYRETGNEEKFADAMQRFKAALDAQVAEGADNWPLNRSQALYAVLAGDYETAIDFMQKSFQQGGYLDTGNATAWPVFKALDGDPRYEAAKAAMNARLQEELKKMELLKGSGSFTQETTQSTDIKVAE